MIKAKMVIWRALTCFCKFGDHMLHLCFAVSSALVGYYEVFIKKSSKLRFQKNKTKTFSDQESALKQTLSKLDPNDPLSPVQIDNTEANPNF